MFTVTSHFWPLNELLKNYDEIKDFFNDNLWCDGYLSLKKGKLRFNEEQQWNLLFLFFSVDLWLIARVNISRKFRVNNSEGTYIHLEMNNRTINVDNTYAIPIAGTTTANSNLCPQILIAVTQCFLSCFFVIRKSAK